MEDPTLTPVLKSLISRRQRFSTSVYDRWFDHEWGIEKKQARFIKAHIMGGVNTKVVTAVETTEAKAHDARSSGSSYRRRRRPSR